MNTTAKLATVALIAAAVSGVGVGTANAAVVKHKPVKPVHKTVSKKPVKKTAAKPAPVTFTITGYQPAPSTPVATTKPTAAPIPSVVPQHCGVIIVNADGSLSHPCQP